MTETLVYDAARDAAGGLTLNNIATAAVVLGLILMSVPMVVAMRRNPAKRARSAVGLGFMAVLAVAVVFGLRTLDSITRNDGNAESIEGVIGSVSPKLFTVGGMKVMISCADAARCPGVAVGDRARVAYVEDSGPETDALAVRIWKQTKP